MESSGGKERYRRDDTADGRETVGNSTEVMRGWTEGKPWEIGRGSSGGKGRYGSGDRVDGRETVGNSSGRAPVGRSDTGMTGWPEGKPWEIAWGQLRWEGAIRKRREGGRKGNRGK